MNSSKNGTTYNGLQVLFTVFSLFYIAKIEINGFFYFSPFFIVDFPR